MKKLLAVFAMVAFFASISTPTFAGAVNENVIINLVDEKPKVAETNKSDKKEGCKSECSQAEQKSCDDQKKKECADKKKECDNK